MEHMSKDHVIAQLRRIKIETGSIACLGCGLEHNCSVHGCRIIRDAIMVLQEMDGTK